LRGHPVRPPPRRHAREREAQLDGVLPTSGRQALGPTSETRVRLRRGRRRHREHALDTGAGGDMSPLLLDAAGITKRFSGITALDNVSITVDEGESVGLIGPNGAGKTTFFNCLLGLLRPDSGRVAFGGRDITRTRVYKRAKLGFARTFQRIELF